MIKTVCMAALAGLAVVSTGCLGAGAERQLEVDLMRAEYLALEDQYYDLQAMYQRQERELERLRRRGESAEADDAGRAADDDRFDDDDGFGPPIPSRDVPLDPDDLPMPDPDRAPTPLSPQDLPEPRTDTSTDDRSVRHRPQPASLRADRRSPDLSIPASPRFEGPIEDWEPVSLVIHPLLAAGYDADGRYGDDGVALTVEARNREGRPLPVAAPVTVVAIDPEEAGEDQRVGRWDFTTDEIGERVADAPADIVGFRLQLPWTDGPPRHRRLLMFVRFELAEGEYLEHSIEVEVRLPGDPVASWTQRATPLASGGPRRSDTAQAPLIGRGSGSSDGAVRRAGFGRELEGRPSWSPYR